MQPGASRPQADSSPAPLLNEIEFVVDVRIEQLDGKPALIVVKQWVRLESARIAASESRARRSGDCRRDHAQLAGPPTDRRVASFPSASGREAERRLKT
jgi:hypothetical protein